MSKKVDKISIEWYFIIEDIIRRHGEVKYIATILKTDYSDTYRVYLDTKEKLYVLKVKETGGRMTYDAREGRFVDVDMISLNIFEHMLIHTYFYINKEELVNMLDTIDQRYPMDFINNSLKMPNVDFNDSDCLYQLSKIIANA